jgi:hypothetical protein
MHQTKPRIPYYPEGLAPNDRDRIVNIDKLKQIVGYRPRGIPDGSVGDAAGEIAKLPGRCSDPQRTSLPLSGRTRTWNSS